MTRVLITGAAGFIGAEVVRQLLRGTDYDVVGVDSFRHRGVLDRLTGEVGGVCPARYMGQRLTVIRHDLAIPISPQQAAWLGPFDWVLAFASGSHVDTSLENPRQFAENNVAVALTTLEFVREHSPDAHVVLVSTDEVYGPVEPGYLHPEWDAIIPSNPYSASKASQEALAVAWWRSFGLAVSIVNMHNVYGPMQHAEKFVPKVIAAVQEGRVVRIHGSAPNHGSRHWLHVADVAQAIIHVAGMRPAMFDGPLAADGRRPSRWNIASGERLTNLEAAQRIAKALGRALEWQWSESRPGRDQHYGLLPARLAAAGWQAATPFSEGIERTVKWYAEHPEWLLP